jgi:hypothetical protein
MGLIMGSQNIMGSDHGSNISDRTASLHDVATLMCFSVIGMGHFDNDPILL